MISRLKYSQLDQVASPLNLRMVASDSLDHGTEKVCIKIQSTFHQLCFKNLEERYDSKLYIHKCRFFEMVF